ncbi:MAG: NAD-dependent epimerase/dehydratase family protein [Thermodesulfobacteriota bacterium]
MKRAMVTGGGGFVGKALTKSLLDQGVEVVVVGRNNYPDLDKPGITLCRGDIRNGAFVEEASRGCDTVFHVAAKAGIWGERDDYFSINVTGTENVIKACRKNAVNNLVYTSTPSVVFNSGDLCGAGESTPYANKFLCHYAETKVLAEKAILQANSPVLKTTALRPHLIWGPGDTNLIPRLVERGKNGLLKQVGTGENMVDIAYIDNVVSAHVKAAANLETKGSAAGRAYFISQGEPVSLWQWINDFFVLAGIPPVKKTISFRNAKLAGALMETVYNIFNLSREPLMTRFLAEQLAHSHWFSIEAATRDFGYRPLVSTEEGMKRTAAWVKETRL